LRFARGQNLRDLIQLVSRESVTLDRTSFDGDLDARLGFDLGAKPSFKFHVVGCMRPSPSFRRSPKLRRDIRERSGSLVRQDDSFFILLESLPILALQSRATLPKIRQPLWL
jgi:hypothetical protein